MTPSEPEYLEIPTPSGLKFLVDQNDLIKHGHLPWNCSTNPGGTFGRVRCTVYEPFEGGGRIRTYILARLILGLDFGDPLEADHINNNPQDNRRINLRACPRKDNALNLSLSRTSTTGFKGVTKVGKNRWAAAIRKAGRNYYLGVFGSPEAAYEAYCEAAAWLHGEFANFGEDRSVEFRLRSLSASEVPPGRLTSILNTPHVRTGPRANKTGFKGVTKVGKNLWSANIRFKGIRHYLGSFDSPEKARQAYCEAFELLREDIDAGAAINLLQTYRLRAILFS